MAFELIRCSAKNDVLIGGSGRDVFVISVGKNIIKDFEVKSDVIGLVHSLSLKFKQKGDNSLIKVPEGVYTSLTDIRKKDFLADYPDNLLSVPAVEVDII